ncbi:MAG: diversity-generating retroelement protein Avd [Candidatus Aenigmatarchaeota archaeon]
MLQNLKIFQKHYDFLLWLQTVAANIPISARFTLAQRLENSALAVMEGIIEANGGEKSALKKASIELEKVRIFIRLAKDLRFIDMKKYENAALQMDEIGKMLGGWMRTETEFPACTKNPKDFLASRKAEENQAFRGEPKTEGFRAKSGDEINIHGFGGAFEGEGKFA